MPRHLRQRVEPAPLCAPHLLDQAGVAQREDGEQPHLLEAVELARDKRTLATPAQDQHRSDGFAERERHDRGVVHGEQRLQRVPGRSFRLRRGCRRSTIAPVVTA